MHRTRMAAATAASLFAAALSVPLAASPVGAAPPGSPDLTRATDTPVSTTDDLTMPWREKYDARNQQALQQRLRRGGTGEAERLERGVYGRAAQTGTDKVFVILAEFGKTRHSAYCDSTEESDCQFPSDGSPQRYDGPLHNQIPKPDRKVDNSTLWKSDYSRSHYRNMYFERMRGFYESQSLGRFSIDGQVTEWVRVPFNEARYGRDFCGDIVCNNTWFLVRDALAFWVDARLDGGWTMDQVRAHLRTFDQQDRYDFDGDGDFKEPDGYIDHLQIVHAGGDQAAADPSFGTDAIWSHRWNAQIEPFGTGPEDGAPIGGVDIGMGGTSSGVPIPDNPTGVWVNDYTIQPENGGLGVFVHEFGHDLGLPDLYDTSGNTGGAENSTGFWTMMSAGSNPGWKTDPGIGDHPVPFGAWEKFQLGWLDYKVIRSGRTGRALLRPGAAPTSTGDNGLVVLLPNKQVPLELGAPCAGCGSQYFYSDAGNDLETTMTRGVEGGGPLTAQVRYEIEDGWDYAFLEASSDGGETWQPLPTSESYDGADESGLDPTDAGISGSSTGWVELTADVPADADAVRWRYVTDSAFVLPGFQVDQITLDGEVIGTAETADEGWELDGFRRTTGSETLPYLHAYFVDNRQYVRQDRTLRSVYNFGFADRPDWVEHYAYEPGALITYWDTSYTDNNVGDHPGHGELLPVDAHPTFDHTPDGALARPRILSYDSTFSLQRTRPLRLHFQGEPYRVERHPAQPLFDDTLDWWYANDEHGVGAHDGRYQPGWYSVDVPKTGTTIRVVKVDRRGNMVVRVGTSN